MQLDTETFRKLLSRDLTNVFIRLGLIIFLVILCVRVFTPFAAVMLWAMILAVALYPLHLRFAKRLWGRQGLSATLLVMASLVIVGVPTVMLGNSFVSQIQKAHTAFENNVIVIEKPDPSVADWPIVGKQVYSVWSAAAEDLPDLIKEYRPQLRKFLRGALSVTADTLGAIMLFIGALIIAGIMMAYGESGSQAMQRILCRFSDPARGPRLQSLSTATIRSVANGVIGVAFIQALILGIGFVIAGIPGAGVLALIILILGIAQVPALIMTLPVIGYIWWSGDASTASNIFYSVYLVVGGMSDNVLKPILLGRGVDAPMPVVLLGALGGMVSAGIIGLFLGAVVLSVGYQVFMEWVDNSDEDTVTEPEQIESADRASSASE